MSSSSGSWKKRGMLTALTLLAGIVATSLGRPVEDRLLAALRELPEEKLQILEGLAYLWDEEMLGDQPQPYNDTLQINDRNSRDREQRLRIIKEQVLKFAGRDGKSNSSSLPQPTKQQSQIMQEVIVKTKYPWPIENVFTEKKQSFYPSCEIPRNSDQEAWDVSQAMNLFFELTYPTPTPGLKLDVHSAKLRLFKRSLSDGFNPFTTPRPGIDQRIRVSVYYYTKAVKRSKAKKKLADSQMLSYYGEDWTELDVKTAVNSWRETGKNFGLAVEVEDEDSTIQQASRYFTPMNCSKEAINARPLPVFFIDALQNKTLIARAGIQFYPTVEISTIEYAEPDILNHKGLRYPITPVTKPHRIRHHHRQTAAVNDSLEQIHWEDPTMTTIR
ncbi:uncharacterized protein LOC106672646 isoform X2 [Cimex lectularius]|uniref:TGF-beta propeptide domain-containing protein n=1 Tax=Cimex lectularius TaxID=79782 RepID=A0A8I6S9Z5_CIMLE|nr:uncharacterized protein LOC106672646 isoform X2 [Cimex lectularius]